MKSMTFVMIGGGLGPFLAPKWAQLDSDGEEVLFGRMPEHLLPVWCERFLGGIAYATRHEEDGRVRVVVQPLTEDFDWTLPDEVSPQPALSGCLTLTAMVMITAALVALVM